MANQAAYPVGAGLARRDGPGKVTGRTAYVDDLPCPNLWYGAVVRAPIAHGRLLAVTPPPGCDGRRTVPD